MKELKFKDIGSCDLEPMACYMKKFNPSFYMGMHNHPYFELMYACKGNFALEVMNRSGEEQTGEVFTVKVRQGELIFIDCNLFHRLVIDEGEPVIYNLELRPSAREEYNPFSINNVYPVNYSLLIANTSLKRIADSPKGYTVTPNLSKIDSSFRELIFAIMKKSACVEDECRIRALMLLLFMEIAKSLALFEQNGVHYVKKVQLYVKHHLTEKITLEAIAKEVGYHKTYLATQFKKYTGKSIIRTVNEMRVSKSLQLLRDTSLPVAEIAKQVGMPSYAQMVHEFNRTVGMSPTACRKAFLNDEVDYDSPQYSSIAIRMNDEDFLLDDEAFNNAFYKKHLNSKSKKLLEY